MTSPTTQPAASGSSLAPSPTAAPLPPAESTAAQAALAGEHAAVWAYAVVTARVPASATARALNDLAAHRAARDALEQALVGRGATPVAARPGYEVPGSAAAVLAAGVEDRLAAVYLDLVQVASAGELLALAGRGVRDCAVRAARWRGSGVAFPGNP